MGQEIPNPPRAGMEWARNAFMVFLAFCLVLFVVSSPVTAEMTGRSRDRLELEQAQHELKEAHAEIKRLRERLDDHLDLSQAAIVTIKSDIVEIKNAFDDIRWLRTWIEAGTRARKGK